MELAKVNSNTRHNGISKSIQRKELIDAFLLKLPDLHVNKNSGNARQENKTIREWAERRTERWRRRS